MKTIKVFLLIIMLVFTFTSCKEMISESSNAVESTTEVSKEESSTVPSVILLREVITTGSFASNKTVYEYDEQNREISRKNYHNNKLSTSIVSRYDENGFKNYEKIIYAISSDFTEENWINSPTGKKLTIDRKIFSYGKLYKNTITYTYDEKDRIISEIYIIDNNTVYEDITYEYLDEYGSRKQTRISDGVKKVSIHTYNASGKIVETQSLNEDGTISSRSITEYDEKNNIIKDISGDVITTFVYEYEGEQIKKQSIYNSKDELSTSYEFTYNEAGDIIKQEDFDASGTRTSVTEYIYR